MTVDPQITANRIAEHLRYVGLSCSTAGSSISESIYLTVSNELDEIKIRISSHDLPPSYGERNGWAVVEVDPRRNPVGRQDAVVAWAIAVKRVAELFGLQPDRRTVAAVSRAERVAKERLAVAKELVAKRETFDREQAERASVRRNKNERVLEELGLSHLTGDARKRKLKKLRAQGRL